MSTINCLLSFVKCSRVEVQAPPPPATGQAVEVSSDWPGPPSVDVFVENFGLVSRFPLAPCWLMRSSQGNMMKGKQNG